MKEVINKSISATYSRMTYSIQFNSINFNIEKIFRRPKAKAKKNLLIQN